MDLVLFSAIPKIALFFLLLVGLAIAAELLYLAKKKMDSPEVTLPSSFARPAMVAVTTEVISETPKKGRFSRKTTMVILSTLLIALTIPVGLALVKQRQIPEKQAAPNECTYGQSCQVSEHGGTQSCTGTLQEGTCKYDSSVNPNCSTCTYCGDGTCGGGEGPDNCPLDCSTAGRCQYQSYYLAGLLPDKPNPDPGCEAQGGIYCHFESGTKNVCCYSDGQCFQGQQGLCTDLGNGSVRTGYSAEIIDYWCPNQHAPGPCSENRASRGEKPPGDYSVNERGCGGLQIDARGLCGSKKFVPCAPGATPTPTPTPTPGGFSAQCTGIGLFDSNWSPITNFSSITVGQTVYLTTRGQTNEPGGITKARFKINANGAWQETIQKHGTDFYIQYTVAAAGTYAMEAEVFNPALGWK